VAHPSPKAVCFGLGVILKPIEKLQMLEQFIAKNGSVEAVLTSGGKSRAVVNRFTLLSAWAGPA
jgi:hypothetical protein